MRRSFYWISLLVLTAVLLITILWLYADQSISSIDRQNENLHLYDRHYMLISGDRSEQWQAIYAASEAAAEKNVTVEWVGRDSMTAYSTEDCMKIAAASRPDGILLYQDPREDLTGLIDEAAGQGIPVVTVLRDAPSSRRVSFIGANAYQMGELYAGQVIKALDGKSGKVLVLLGSTGEDNGMNLLYSQLLRTVESSRLPEQKIEFSSIEINNTGSFVVEEDVRDIFIHTADLPDVLICVDPVSTESAFQALVDYNAVGRTAIIGYYVSDPVQQAMDKGLIFATLAIDAGKIGTLCIEALDEYCLSGYVSEYFNVGIDVISGADPDAQGNTDITAE